MTAPVQAIGLPARARIVLTVAAGREGEPITFEPSALVLSCCSTCHTIVKLPATRTSNVLISRNTYERRCTRTARIFSINNPDLSSLQLHHLYFIIRLLV